MRESDGIDSLSAEQCRSCIRWICRKRVIESIARALSDMLADYNPAASPPFLSQGSVDGAEDRESLSAA
jgi:hypothetical protein